MKRLIFLIAVPILAVLFAACSNEGDEPTDDTIDLTNKYDSYYEPALCGTIFSLSYGATPPLELYNPGTKKKWVIARYDKAPELYNPVNLVAITREHYTLESYTNWINPYPTKYQDYHKWENCDSAKVFGRIVAKTKTRYGYLFDFEIDDDLNGVYSADGVTISWNDGFLRISTASDFVPEDKYWNLYIRNGKFLNVFPIFFSEEGYYDFERSCAYQIRDFERSKK